MREFLAIPLPEPLRTSAAELSRTLPLPPDRWRFVRAEGLHVTMRFLGEVEPAAHPTLHTAWRDAAGGVGALQLRIDAAVVAPIARRPRIVWLPVGDETPHGGLGTLAGRIEQAARACGFPPEVRRFEGHVTLARARGGRRVPPVELPEAGSLGSFVADRLVLYRSRLSASGATYEELASYPLDAARPS